MRSRCTLAVPTDLEHGAKKRLVQQITKTIGEARGWEVEEIHLPSGTKIYNNWVLTFFRELPPDKAALGGFIAAEDPLVRLGAIAGGGSQAVASCSARAAAMDSESLSQ